MRLQSNRHTGRVLPHHHTHFLALFGLLLSAGLILFGFSWAADSFTLTGDGAYSVNAVVPSSVPIVAARITSPQSGITVTTPTITVSGFCQVGNLIKVFRNDIMAGADFCSSNGTFSFPVSLFLGSNTLIARSYNALDEAGPDSSAVLVTYQPTAFSATAIPVNAGVPLGQLQILGDTSYHAFQLNQETSWLLEIKGGQAPYAVSINWGDGTSDLISRTAAGIFVVKHTYHSAPKEGRSYGIDINASDAAGNKANLHLGALLAVPPPTNKPNNEVLKIAWPIWLIALLLLISFAIGSWTEDRRIKAERRRATGLAT